VSLRVGFDLDGVLADMEAELVRQATLVFGEAMTRRLQERAAPPPPDPAARPASASPAGEEAVAAGAPDGQGSEAPPLLRLNMTTRQQRRLWRHVESIENFWETLHEIEPGIVKQLAAIATERRWELIFLTRRPTTAGATAQVQSQRWLIAHGFPLPSVYVVQGSRGRIAHALDLDIVVDDLPENCLDIIAESKARAILVSRDDPRRLPITTRRLGIGVVRSVAECLDILVEVDDAPREQPGMMSRVKRLLGLKEAAEAGEAR
jgi:hypothetical protein